MNPAGVRGRRAGRASAAGGQAEPYRGVVVEIPALIASVTVPTAPPDTFARFTDGFGSWWPAEFTWSQPALLASIGMDCRPGGLLTETGPYGFRVDWGRIQGWQPPTAMSFTWQISAERVPVPDPARASVVSVSFAAHDGGTTVTVTHDAWDRHGPGAAGYRDQFAAAWPLALERFREHTERWAHDPARSPGRARG